MALEQSAATLQPNGLTDRVETLKTDMAATAPKATAQFSGAMPMFPGAMEFDLTPPVFPNISWDGPQNVNRMGQFVPTGMFNFQNQMGTYSFPMCSNV
jgi:hypothetical protein